MNMSKVMNVSMAEVSLLGVYRRRGLAGLAEVSIRSYRKDQRDLVYSLNRRIEELEDRIQEMRDSALPDDPTWSAYMKGEAYALHEGG